MRCFYFMACPPESVECKERHNYEPDGAGPLGAPQRPGVVPLRALDALHLATALTADTATMVTFDPRLREAAASQGLFVAPVVVD